MTTNKNKYEQIKQKKEQLLVRNEFLYNLKSVGKYNIPIIRKQKINVEDMELLSYCDAKTNDEANRHKTLHFFTYDWKFEKVYEQPDEEIEKLKQYKCVLSPDFSLFTNMPLALQIYSAFKNRWCGAYWQSKGINVIPTVSWGDENTFDFCFDGIEKGSIVAVCTYYRENCEEDFMLGYNEMIKRIEPSLVICYDEPFKTMTGNIKWFLPTTFEWTKKLNAKELAQFKWEKQNKNVSGLNPADFKYFKYEDPLAKNNIVKCSICGSPALQDDYGNGECAHCGWKFSANEKEFEQTNGISYPMLVSPTTARKQYKNGQPFKATFEEFIKGLYFYSEMLFSYNNTMYEVFLKANNTIVFCCDTMQQEFKSQKDFEEKANINGKLLKDIWANVSFAGFMFCG